ncbi:hypothetical protein ACLG6S_17630 [Thermodesulfobacteriota bacterium B35]
MNFFLIFHHNLAFSSIPTKHYRYLVDNVYRRLLDIAESGIPLGMEYTGETLELIADLSPSYIARLRTLLARGQAELIGSSYSQAIFPLIPARVNRWNLKYGIETYEKTLGTRPTTALVNEQCYSDGLADLYREAGYEAIIFDWMNARKEHPWPENWRYQPVVHAGTGLIFLWSDCISFQKLQRTIWGELDEEEWEDFIDACQSKANSSSVAHPLFSLYASDAEVFDYHPGTLETWTADRGHFKKLHNLLAGLTKKGKASILLPSRALARASTAPLPEIERVCTPSYPVRTKKQDKYNVTRWAVTGRASARMNTQCYRLFAAVSKFESATTCPPGRLDLLRKELVSLWGSDFRTHTTDEKIENFRNRMGAALFLADAREDPEKSRIEELPSPPMTGIPGKSRRKICLEKGGASLTILKNRGMAIEAFTCRQCGPQPLLGTIPHGYFPDISLASDFYTGHIMLITQDGRQYTDLSVKVPELEITDQEDFVLVRNRLPMELPGLTVFKSLYLEENSLTIRYDMYARDLRPASLRLGICTFPPGSFHRETLFYETANGGDRAERFYLKGMKVAQDSPANHIVTCRHCLGNTDGRLVVGDATKWLTIVANPVELYSVPLVHYEEVATSTTKPDFYLRVYHSICERDDVANVFWKGEMSLSFKITAASQSAPAHKVARNDNSTW